MVARLEEIPTYVHHKQAEPTGYIHSHPSVAGILGSRVYHGHPCGTARYAYDAGAREPSWLATATLVRCLTSC